MSDFRAMTRGGPPSQMMRPMGPGHMINQGTTNTMKHMAPGGPLPIITNLCPEFLKGECVQFQCPKNHPEASLLFCQAYQRDMCQNGQNCTFMHATVEEEQYYKETGLIPLRFMHQNIRMERGKGPLPNGQPPLFPVDTANNTTNTTTTTNNNSNTNISNTTPKAETFTVAPVETTAFKMEPVIEKQKMDISEGASYAKRQKLSYDELEGEVSMLREKVRVLEKRVEQLDNTNELLLEKNAKLRSSSKRSPDRRRSRSPDKRDDRGRRHGRDRSRERNRSREAGRGGGGGGRWSNDFGNNYNRGPSNQNM